MDPTIFLTNIRGACRNYKGVTRRFITNGYESNLASDWAVLAFNVEFVDGKVRPEIIESLR